MSSVTAPQLPFPVYKTAPNAEKYALYDIDVITWLRRTHNILGVLIGTLPQIPSQNVFLGLPLQLQVEEARLLVDLGLAYVIDDFAHHQQDYAARSSDTIRVLQESLAMERKEIAQSMRDAKKMRSESASKRAARGGQKTGKIATEATAVAAETEDDIQGEASDGLFKQATECSSLSDAAVDEAWSVTLSSNTKMLSTSDTSSRTSIIPQTKPSAYALFKRLHEQGYFMTPGLRFGCQFSVYPGDPLRYHSHFLAISADWDEEMDLLHLIGGGRLGTGVKKGWMIGGVEANERHPEAHDKETGLHDGHAKVRTFCIEWGGM